MRMMSRKNEKVTADSKGRRPQKTKAEYKKEYKNDGKMVQVF